MLDILIEFKSIIFLCLLIIGFSIFRREINKFLDWLVRLKKIAGTKGDYKVSAETESPGTPSEPKAKKEDDQSFEKKAEIVEAEQPTKKIGWFTFFRKKEYDKTIEILEEELSLEHDIEKRNSSMGFIGWVKFKKNNKEGVEYFEDALKQTHGNPNIYYWYATSYNSIEKHKKAIDITKKGIDSNPSASILHDLFADCLVNASREIEAVEMLFEQLKKNPETPTHYTKIAEILSEMGKNELARDCFRLGFKHCPNNISFLEKYGDILSKMDEHKEAMFIYLRLIVEKPEEARFWVLLGNNYFLLSFHDLAFEAYKKGNELAKEGEGWIISNIGNLMTNRGFHTEGASYLKKGLSIEPDSQYAHERLANSLKAAADEVEKRSALVKEVNSVVRSYRSSEDIISEVKNESSQQDDSVDA